MAATSGVFADSCLVLNINYQPINVIPVWKALSMLFRERAEIVYVDEGYYKSYALNGWFGLSEMKMAEGIDDDEALIYGIDKTFIAPKVIRTLFYGAVPPSKGIALTRRNIYLRDDYTCQFCGRKLPTSELNIDHVVPKSRGGRMTWNNVVCSCIRCNNKKAARTPQEAGMRLLRKPFQPRHNLTLFDKAREPKYKKWQDFVDQIYYDTELKE